MNDQRPKVFKLVKTNFALDFLKNNTSLASASEGIIFYYISKVSCFKSYRKLKHWKSDEE